MGEFLIGLGAGLIAFIIAIAYSAERFKGGSDFGFAFWFGLGVSLTTWGVLILWF